MNRKPEAGLVRTLRAAPLYAAFAGTGIGVALPGALLPALMARWHLGDEQAGRLFLAAWTGSSLGALLVRGSLRAMVSLGSASIAAGALAIAFSTAAAADVALALFGLGLGMTMTSISLMRQQQSARSSLGSGAEMVRLNLLWAAGACACPTLALRALAVGAVGPLLFGLALPFALLSVWMFFQPDLQPAAMAARRGSWQLFRNTPWRLIVMTLLVPGIEASAGAWLATFARRGEHTLAATVAAPSLFWAGLLLSRAFWSVWPQALTHDRVVRWSSALMALSTVLLVVAHGEPLVLSAAFLLGFGIGPVYPLLLAWALTFQRGGTIFFLCGAASAALPWLTGLVSSSRHSLRTGFSVPMLGTLLLLLLAGSSPLTRWSRVDAPET